MPKHRLLDKLFRRHSMELVTFAHTRVSQSDAEDLVQEAYLRLLQHPDYATIHNPRAYLYKIIANLGFDYHRRASIHNQHIALDDIEPDSLISPHPSPETLTDGQLLLKKCLA